MKLHPRHILRATARKELGQFLQDWQDWQDRHKLYDVEYLVLLTEEVNRRLQSCQRSQKFDEEEE